MSFIKSDIKESKDTSNNCLDQYALKNDIDLEKQIENKEKLFSHRVRYCTSILALSIAGITVIIYLWHIMGPHNLRWLDESEVDNLQKISLAVLSGVFSSIASTYFLHKK